MKNIKSEMIKTKTKNGWYCKKCGVTVKNWKKHEQTDIHGAGLMDWLKDGYNKIINLFKTSKELTTKAKKLLEKYGDKKIIKIELMRTPLNSFIDKIINFFSGDALDKEKVLAKMDSFFHLAMIVTVNDDGLNKNIIVEKNERINISTSYKSDDETMTIYIPVDIDITINEMLSKAVEKYGKEKIFIYDGLKANCSLFIEDLLEASNLQTPESEEFLKQNRSLDNLSENMPDSLKFVMKKLTDVANVGSKIINGGNLEKQNLKGSGMSKDVQIWLSKNVVEPIVKLYTGDKIVNKDFLKGSGLYEQIHKSITDFYKQTPIKGGKLYKSTGQTGGESFDYEYDQDEITNEERLYDVHNYAIRYDYEKYGPLMTEHPIVYFTGKFDSQMGAQEAGLIKRLLLEKYKDDIPFLTKFWSYYTKDYNNRQARIEAEAKMQKQLEEYQRDRNDITKGAFWKEFKKSFDKSFNTVMEVGKIGLKATGNKEIADAVDKIQTGVNKASDAGGKALDMMGGAFKIHSVKISKDVKLKDAKDMSQKFIKDKRKTKYKDDPNYYSFQNIPKGKFKPKSFRTKVINDNIQLVLGETKN